MNCLYIELVNLVRGPNNQHHSLDSLSNGGTIGIFCTNFQKKNEDNP